MDRLYYNNEYVSFLKSVPSFDRFVQVSEGVTAKNKC